MKARPVDRLSKREAPSLLSSVGRRNIFYLKTDIALPDADLQKLAQQASVELRHRITVVADLARKAGFPGAVEPLAAGTYHVVHRVVPRSGAPVIVRSTLAGIFDDDFTLEIDSKVRQWLQPHSHLVPETLALGRQSEGAPFDFVIQAFASGVCLSELGDSSLDDAPEFLFEMGRALCHVHDVAGRCAGLLDCDAPDESQPTGVHSSWTQYIWLRLDEHIQTCARAGYLNDEITLRILHYFNEYTSLLDVRPRRLLHGDLGIHNVCVNTRTKVISAMLDWEDALIGDPLFDLAMVSSFQPPRRLPEFYRGYGLNQPSLEEQRLLALYFLRIALSKTVHRLRFGVRDKPGRTPAHQRLYRGLAELDRLS